MLLKNSTEGLLPAVGVGAVCAADLLEAIMSALG